MSSGPDSVVLVFFGSNPVSYSVKNAKQAKKITWTNITRISPIDPVPGDCIFIIFLFTFFLTYGNFNFFLNELVFFSITRVLHYSIVIEIPKN